MNAHKVLHLRSGRNLFGPERVILALARYSSAQFEHIVGAIEEEGPSILADTAQAEGFANFRLPCRGRIDFAAISKLAAYVCDNDICIINAHDLKANFYALAAARRARVATVTTVHSWKRSSETPLIYAWLDARQVRAFDRIIAVAPDILQAARRSHCAEHKLRLILNGVDMARFAPRTERIGVNNLIIGSVGRLVAEKGYSNLLLAAVEICRVHPKVQFLLVGDGPLRGELEAQATQLGIAARVIFAGQCDNVAASYAQMDMYVLSSLTEGLPIVLLEAMASQLPIVATTVGAVAEVIAPDCGLLVPPDDVPALTAAILKLLEDPPRAGALAAAAYRRVREVFSAQVMTQKTEAVYQELLDGPSID
jgi:L-malate glycosyltransferase